MCASKWSYFVACASRPKMGDLYQVTANGSQGALIDPFTVSRTSVRYRPFVSSLTKHITHTHARPPPTAIHVYQHRYGHKGRE